MEQDEATRRPGRPRNEAIDEAALEAAIDLLIEGGVRAVTVEAVARRAGTTPPAIYRRWPSSDDLLWAAVRRQFLSAANRTSLDGPYSIDGLEFEAALRQVLRRSAQILSNPRLIASYLALAMTMRSDPEMLQGRERFRKALHGPLPDLVKPAADSAGIRPDDLAELLVGSIVFRLAIERSPPNEETIAAIASVVAAGCQTLARARDG
jgi:AcrR family transcriptional regulator